MPRIELQNPETATGERKEILSQIHAAFGTTPNMFKAIANSTPALKMMWSAFGALGGGKLGPKLGEQIAIAVADVNRCEYCLAAHTALGNGAGLSAETMSQAQRAKSNDPKTQAALTFAVKVVKERANISPDDISALRKAGYSEEDVAEILAHVALNIFTNYTNVAFDVPIDFPKVALS
ncbi:MAG: carboxymuconolactone decarboxylase [Bdellovibrio sp. CG10_big_fil_rev_8_21_14_0_10_47_8]|nr:MAG: carboxymuconolactone decarboxylase [Bdellovibrio sp. CG10_big_fil_rev_8_21_14_0_10_47_8]